jgi:hypothetical protein
MLQQESLQPTPFLNNYTYNLKEMTMRNDTVQRIWAGSIVKHRKSGEDDVITNIIIKLNKFEELKDISWWEEARLRQDI